MYQVVKAAAVANLIDRPLKIINPAHAPKAA